MVSFHVWTFVLIIVLLFLFSPIVDGNNNKHRVTHRHRNHRHHHHRKYPKHHPPSIKNSLEKYARRTNLTKILSTVRWSPTETSTSVLFLESSYSDNERITSSANLSTVQNTTNINLYNSTRMPSGIHNNSSHSYATSSFVRNINNISSTSMKNIVENSPNITTGIIDDLVDPNYLPLPVIPEETSKIAASDSRSPGTSSREEHRRYAQDLRELFGSAEEGTNLPKILIDAPIVQLVRKKRSIPSEELDATHERSREPSLLDFNGPSIENDPEEVLNRDSSESLHRRVKRDDPEPEVIPLALSSQDANYFRDLEDSFALSALEVEAREARGYESHRRSARQSQSGIDSFLSLSRPKREAEDDKNQSYSAKGHSAELKKMPLADYIMENDDSESIEKIGDNENRRNASRNLLAGVRDRANGIIDAFRTTHISAESVDYFSSITLELERSKNPTHSLDSSTSPLPTARETEDNKTDTIYVVSSSQSSGPDNYTVKVDEPITGYRVEDAENDEKTSSASLDYREINDREVEEKNRQPEVESVSVDSSLKDENSISRYGLDDVYPEIVEDPANPSPMVRLVRTKRFGDGVSNPEAPEVSYASEVDNSRVVLEPYSEDNRIIDSMLSKVDYRSGYAQPSRSARKENEARLDEENIYSPTGEGTPVRNKRGVSSRRARKKGGGRRRGSKKHKKSHKGRAKKHRPKLKRSKVKRESDDLSEGLNLEWEEKFEPADDNFDSRRLEAIDKDLISPHDGRRRRLSEDEDEENFYPDRNEAADRYRRDIRDSGNVDNSEGHRDEEVRSISVFPEGRSKPNEKTKNREKRDNGLQEMKYFQNIRETDGGQNRSEENAEKRLLSVDAVKPIRDIEQIVEELLAKVNELRGYVSEVGTPGAAKDSQASGTASSAVDRTTAERSEIVDGVTASPDGSSSRPAVANVEGQPEACRKYPASRTRQSASAKSNGRPARNLRAQRCSKKARRKRTSHRKWDRWTDWSSCSVTCGRGRQIRWRHCIRNCSTAETEMEEKACQLPACAPGKFLGIFG